jgi:signal transduction histidine kinase
MNDRQRITRITTWIAGAVAVTLTLLLPLGYFGVSYRYMVGSLEAEAEMASHNITELINANPELWHYEQVRLERLLTQRMRNEHEEARRILDPQNRLIAESVNILKPPLITRRFNLLDAGVTVGKLEISCSLFPILLRSGLVALLGSACGVVIFVTLRVLPLRAVERAEKSLLESNSSLEAKNREIETAYAELKATQAQMLQNDKMASIGQLAAGVAHEINNPIGFVTSNLSSLERYMAKIVEFITAQSERIAAHAPAEAVSELAAKRKSLKLDYILDDMKSLIAESLDGTGRVQKIVQDLKSFSRIDTVEHSFVDINACLESTINIVWNEIKYKATLQRDFGDLPLIKCHPQQLNQVFMNLLINAGHAIDKEGTISVRSRHEAGLIQIAISDTGCGIPEEIRARIFEPFFTTKEVGKGTGLGLSISYDIVKKHGGEIRLASEVGKGTTFTVLVPVASG